eukprot:1161240-Pelagomonas_calceolata.AAC.11
MRKIKHARNRELSKETRRKQLLRSTRHQKRAKEWPTWASFLHPKTGHICSGFFEKKLRNSRGNAVPEENTGVRLCHHHLATCIDKAVTGGVRAFRTMLSKLQVYKSATTTLPSAQKRRLIEVVGGMLINCVCWPRNIAQVFMGLLFALAAECFIFNSLLLNPGAP